jgi:hypothetical protein
MDIPDWKLFAIAIGVLTVVASCGNGEEATEYVFPEAKFTQGDTLTVTGILIDTHCYALDKENIGHDHNLPQSGFREDCAEYCALQGYPVGVLIQEDGEEDYVWAIMTASQIFADYMTETARVRGTVRSDGVLDPLDVELKDGPDSWITIM